jgi:hypothetical protein
MNSPVQFNCFVSGTPVLVESGMQMPIEDIKIGDTVITHLGNVKRVCEIYQRVVDEKVLKIDVSRHVNDTLVLTGEHPVFAIKAKDVACVRRSARSCSRNTEKCSGCGFLDKDIAEPTWMEAKDLEVGDYVVSRYSHKSQIEMPFLELKNLSNDFDIDDDGKLRSVVFQNTKFGWSKRMSTGRGIRPSIHLNDDVMWMFGLYLAEADNVPSRRCVRFSVSKGEIDSILKRIENILIVEFDIPEGCCIIEERDYDCATLSVHNVVFSRVMNHLFGHGAKEKSIASFIMSLSDRQLLSMVAGLFEGDGCLSETQSSRLILRLYNKMLIEQVMSILDRLDIPATIDSGRFVDCGFGKNGGFVYSISVSSNYACSLYKLIAKKDYPTCRSHRNFVSLNSCHLDRISSIEEVHYSGKVYNVAVEDDNSYIVNGVAVHNCGLHHIYGIDDKRKNSSFWRWDAKKGKPVKSMNLYEHPQLAACFILSVEDNMESIMELAKTEAMIFKFGSGAGVSNSPLRSKMESLSGGGKPSGPLSFARIRDQVGGVVESGGKTRRAAKLECLDISHPDIMEFIEAKANEERKARHLLDAGYSGGIDGEAYKSVMFQNSNFSVRVTDEFMEAYNNDEEVETRAVVSGDVLGRYKAKDLFHAIAESCHFCGDPAIQFDTNTNAWNTCPKSGRINASNPCLTGETEIYIVDNDGNVSLKKIGDIEDVRISVLSYDFETNRVVKSKARNLMKTRMGARIVKVKTKKGAVRLTPDHEVMTQRGWIQAGKLQKGDKVYSLKKIPM